MESEWSPIIGDWIQSDMSDQSQFEYVSNWREDDMPLPEDNIRLNEISNSQHDSSQFEYVSNWREDDIPLPPDNIRLINRNSEVGFNGMIR